MFDEDEYNAKSAAFQEVEPSEDPFQSIASTDKLQAALQYTSAGLKIFPCPPGEKRPHPWTHGFKDASNILRAPDNPRLQNLGWLDLILPDGSELTVTPHDKWAFEPGLAGLTVVDIDPKNGGDTSWGGLIDKHGLITTRQVRTPSGGSHLYFRGTISAVNKKLGPGIDTRCFGGYVLLPPSSIRGIRYEWVDPTIPIVALPDWARDLAEAQDEYTDGSEDDAAFEAWTEAGGEGGRFEFLLSRIGDEASGGGGFYNPMLSAAGYGARVGMSLDEIIDRIGQAALSAPRGNRLRSYITDKIAGLPSAVRKFRRLDQVREAEAQKFAEELEAEAAAKEEEVAEEPRPFPSDNGEWISPEEAIESLRPPIRAWLERDSSHEKTLTILQSAAGLGKTRTMLEEQQRAGREDRRRAEQEDQSELAKLERKVSHLSERLRNEGDPAKQQPIERELGVQLNLWIEELLAENLAELPPLPLGKMGCAAPRHKLAQEIQEIDRKLRGADTTEEQIPILQGRNSSNCQRYELVAKAQEKGFEPSACCHRTLSSGEEVFCPFYGKCSTDPTQYLANQSEVKHATNVIIQHAHLGIPWLDSLALSSRKRMWIDENPCQTFVITKEVSDDYLHDLVITERDFAALERQRAKHGITPEKLEKLAELSQILLKGLVPPGKLRIEKHLKGWSAAELRRAGVVREAVESWRRGDLNPGLSDAALSKQIDKIGTPPRKLAGLLYRLAAEVEERSKGQIYSLARNPKTGKIVIRGRVPTNALPPNLLLTDATPSREILAAVFPEYAQELIEIPVRRNAFITQTSEPVFSKNWLLKEGHLPEVVDWIKRIATRYHNLVVLTTKKIRCAITEEDTSPDAKLPIFFEIHGARIGHYGNLRGSNEFADCDALVILGREQPNVEDMEAVAKAIWFDTAKPLKLSADGYYLKVTRPYLMRDGSKPRGEVMVHWDPRVQAVLTACRENELIQALDRARLIWGEPKDVYILCDIPLPGVEIDRLVPWDVLRGADRLSKAIDAQAARGKRALPLSARRLAKTFPEPGMWETEKAAERWLENSPEIKDLRKNPHLSNRIFLLGKWGFLAEYRLPGQKRWSAALVWDADQPGAALADALEVQEADLTWRRSPASSSANPNSKDFS